MHVAPRWAGTAIGDVRYSDVAAWVAELWRQRGRVDRRDRLLGAGAHPRRRGARPAARIQPGARRETAEAPAAAQRVPDRRASCSGLPTSPAATGSLVLLLGVGGLRWGEAAALRVCDVDFLRRRVELHRNAVYVGAGFAVGSLKCNKSRTVVLPAFVVDALAQTAEGKRPRRSAVAVTVGGYLVPPSSADSWLAGAVRRCQKADPTFPRVTAHALRHTAASLAISAGANPKVVQRMLGHASAAMTLDVYADLFDADLGTVAESVAKMWPRQEKPAAASPQKRR